MNIAFQMPVYPMIDDTQPDDPDRAMDSLIWNTDLNRIGWSAYLAGLHEQGAEIPAYAAPARNSDHSGFPPTITLAGTLEPFHQEPSPTSRPCGTPASKSPSKNTRTASTPSTCWASR